MQATTSSLEPESGVSPAPLVDRLALAGLCLSMLMPSLDTSIANAALPTLSREFAASFQHVQWIVLAYLLAITTLIVSAGRLGDIVGRRRLLIAGLAVFTAGSLLCGAAPTYWHLIAARAAQGIGAAVMMPLSMAMIGAAVPKERVGSAMGLLGTMSAIGTTLGPSLGGVLIVGFGWRSIFLINVPIGVLTLFLVLRGLPRDSRASGKAPTRFDTVGTALLGLSLATYALAMTIGHGRFGGINILLGSIAAIGAILFMSSQRGAPCPLLPLDLFEDHALRSGLGMSLLVSTVMMATLVVGPFYLASGLGLEPAQIGLLLSAGPLVATLAGLPAGRLVDRFGAHPMTFAGLLGMTAGLFALTFAPQLFGIPGYLVGIMVVTAHYGLFQSANITAIMSSATTGNRGLLSGLMTLSRNLGLITGVAVMGAVFARAATVSEMSLVQPDAVATGMRASFGVATLLMVVALGICAMRHRGAWRMTD